MVQCYLRVKLKYRRPRMFLAGTQWRLPAIQKVTGFPLTAAGTTVLNRLPSPWCT